MKVYKIIVQRCDSEGKYYMPCVLESFSTKELAMSFKKDWEDLWQKHYDNKECVYPCWYDSKKELEIAEEEIKTEYNGLNEDK